MKKIEEAYIVRKMYNGKESLVCYLTYANYICDSMSWAIYDNGQMKIIEAITREIVKLQWLGYEIIFKDELD